MKMIEIMKGAIPEIEKKTSEVKSSEDVRMVVRMYEGVIGEMTAALMHEAQGEGLEKMELTAVCAVFKTAHRILDDMMEPADVEAAEMLSARVYRKTRTIAIRREVKK